MDVDQCMYSLCIITSSGCVLLRICVTTLDIIQRGTQALEKWSLRADSLGYVKLADELYALGAPIRHMAWHGTAPNLSPHLLLGDT